MSGLLLEVLSDGLGCHPHLAVESPIHSRSGVTAQCVPIKRPLPLETFTSRGEFLAKAHTYQLYFNLVRPNSHKENQSPWQIIERLAPRSPLELCLLPPVFLDYYLNDAGGYDVPRLPYAAGHKQGTRWRSVAMFLFLGEGLKSRVPGCI